MVERTEELRIEGDCPTGPLSIAKINRKLEQLTKFAKATQRQLADVDRFLQLFFRCTGFVQGHGTIPPVPTAISMTRAPVSHSRPLRLMSRTTSRPRISSTTTSLGALNSVSTSQTNEPDVFSQLRRSEGIR
jgi:hypothetical protein